MAMNSTDSNEFSQYNEQPATRTMRNIPRFGHSSSFAMMFSENEDDSTDYILGLLLAGCFIFAIFVCWTLMLLVFKCLGKKRVGFLSGSAFQVPRSSKRPRRIRIIFVLSTILMLTFAVLLVTQGLTKIYVTYDTLIDSMRDVGDVMTEADEVAFYLNTVVNSTSQLVNGLVQAIGNGSDFCAQDPNLANETGVDFNATTNEIVGLLQGNDFFDPNYTTSLYNSIDTAESGASEWMDGVQKYDINDWQSLIVIIPYSVVAFFFLLGMLLVWCEKKSPKFECFLSWLILPIFLLMIMASYVVCGLIAIVASGNADFCSGGDSKTPDGTFQDILEIRGYNEGDLLYQVVSFYMSQCARGDPFDVLQRFEDALMAIRGFLQTLATEIASVTLPKLKELCGEDFTALVGFVNALKADIRLLLESLVKILEILRCDRLVPIYTNTFYDATCTSSVTGVTWVFAAFLVVSFFGMLMITFRAAYLPTNYLDDDKEFSAMGTPDESDDIDNEKDEYQDEYVPYDPKTAAPKDFEDSYESRETGDSGSYEDEDIGSESGSDSESWSSDELSYENGDNNTYESNNHESFFNELPSAARDR